MTDHTDTRLAALFALGRVTNDLGPDELRVLAYLAHRLAAGEPVYGPLDLANDKRDFERVEAIEEDADGAIYRAMARVQRSLRPDPLVGALERAAARLRVEHGSASFGAEVLDVLRKELKR